MITQIYCIRTVEEALEVIEAGADYIGLTPPQNPSGDGAIPGLISEKMTFDILAATKGKAKRVFVLVSDKIEDYYNCVQKYRPDIIHFSADDIVVSKESAEKLKALASGILIEQAVGVSGPESVEIAKERAKYADILILDTATKDIEGIGASGIEHDWGVDKQIVDSVNIPVIIAGGLGPENVREAILASNPFGVDSLTKTNKTGSYDKDIAKVRAFCETAKSVGKKKITKPILCMGDAHPDIIVNSNKTDGEPIEMLCGGTVANTAIVLKKLGLDVSYFGKVGGDALGDFTKKHLHSAGIDTRWLLSDQDVFTEMVICLIDKSGDRDFLIYPKKIAYSELKPTDIPDNLFSEIGMAYTTGTALIFEPGGEATLSLLKRCNNESIPVAFDVNLREGMYDWSDKIQASYDVALGASDIIFASGGSEISIIGPEENVEDKIKTHVKHGKIVVSKNGKAGATVYSEHEAYDMPAFDVKVKDTVGAGDIFNAGFLSAYIDGASLKDCLIFGSAAACYSIQFAGNEGAPTKEDVTNFVQGYIDTANQTKRIY